MENKIKIIIHIIFLFILLILNCNKKIGGYLNLTILNKLDSHQTFIRNKKLPNENKTRYLYHLEDSYKRIQTNNKNKPLTMAVQKYVRSSKIKIMIKTQLDYHGVNDNYLFSTENETVRFTLSSNYVSKVKLKLTYNDLIKLLEEYKYKELKTIKSNDSFSLHSVFITVFYNGYTNQFAILNPQWFKYRDKDSIVDYNKNRNHIEIAKLAMEK